MKIIECSAVRFFRLPFLRFHCLSISNGICRAKNFKINKWILYAKWIRTISLTKSKWNDWTKGDIDTVKVYNKKKKEKELTTQIPWMTVWTQTICVSFSDSIHLLCVWANVRVCIFVDNVKDDIHKIVENVLFIAS